MQGSASRWAGSAMLAIADKIIDDYLDVVAELKDIRLHPVLRARKLELT